MSPAMSEQRSLHVLIVEDEPGDARLMQLALRNGGFAIEMNAAGDGVEALQMLRREGERFRAAPRPDLILLDLNMPRLDGRECLAALKQDESLRDIPVVILTTSEVERDVLTSYTLGAAGFITKPMDVIKFIAAIRDLGVYWFDLVRLPRQA